MKTGSTDRKSRGKKDPAENKFASVFYNSPEAAILAHYPEGRITDVNEAFERLSGYLETDITGKTFGDLGFIPDPVSLISSTPDEGTSVKNYNAVFRTKSGNSIDVFLNPCLLETDNTQYIILYLVNNPDGQNTAFTLAENSLRYSEDRYRALHESLRDPFVKVDMEGRIMECNDLYCNLLGYSPDEIKTITYRDITPGKWHGFEDEIVKNQIIKRGYSDVYEKEYIRKDGKVIPVELRTILFRDSSGKPESMWAIIRDISGRKETEQALRVSQERYMRLFESMTEGFALHEIITNDEGKVVDYRFLEINPAFEQLTGLRKADLLGKRVKEVMPDTEDYWIENYGAVALTGQPRHFENYSSTLDRWYEVFAYRTAPRQFAVIFTDISVRKATEKALRESEEKYRNLFVNMAEEVHFWQLMRDDEGNIKTWRLVDANPPTLKSWGRKSVEEMRGKTTDEIFGPGATEHFMPVVQKIFSEGTAYSYEDYFPNLDKHFRFTSVPFGEYFISTGADITDLIKAHEDLKQSRESLQRAQAVGKIGNWRLDLVKNELVWSDENYRIFEIEKGTPLTYESFLSTIHPDDREYVDRKWKAGMAGEDYDIEHRIIANGTVKWVREKAFLEFDDKGELSSGFGITQDITEKKNVEMELTGSRRKLDLALQNANIGLWEWNVRTNEITWDERTDKMFCLDPGSFKGNYDDFLKLVHDEDVEHLRKAIRNTIQNNVPYETIFRVKACEGKHKYISSKALVNRDSNGEILSLTGVGFDITDLREGTELLISKLNEDLLRSNKELESFAYITSHDLQEPLRMITSFSQLLEQQYGDKLDQNGKEYISFAVDGARRMYELINGLLAYSRISRKEITFREVDTNMVIDNVRSNMALTIKERKCEIFVTKLPVVFADHNQMIQLFQNLIANGIKFSADPPRIHVSSITEKTHYVFSVKDEGIGIEPLYFDKIFMIFKRLLPRDKYEGTGIGLAICKRIVENHGGKIWVESEPGKGSCFHFSIAKNQQGIKV